MTISPKSSSLRQKIMLSILSPIFLVLLIIFVFNYLDKRNELLSSYKILQTKSENNIITSIKVIDTSYRMVEKLIAPDLEKAFNPFLEEYNRYDGNIKLMDLQRVISNIGQDMKLYVIDSAGVIRKSNVSDSIGIDFSQKSTFYPRITKIREGNNFQYDRLATDLNSGEIRFWAFMPTPDHNYLLEIGTTYDVAKFITQEMDLKRLTNSLISLDQMISNIRIFDENGFQLDKPDFRPDEKLLESIDYASKNGNYSITDKDKYIKYIHINLDGEGIYPTDPSKIVEITYNTKIISDKLNNQILMHIIISGIFLLIVIFIIKIITNQITRPILQLNDAVLTYSEKNFDSRVPVNSDDEIGRLSESFNHMAGIIQEYHSHLKELNIAYERFVPVEFLQSLEKESIIDVQLGDQIQKDMPVMFADIRNFTSISEKMTPKQIFKYLNSYLKKVGPIIRENSGFIDKYIGDGIMALFPLKADYAVKSAIEMQKAITKYNNEQENKGYPEVKIGIGIHLGTLMLGTIGEEKRMEGTVISDAVNLASRLEGQTKVYGVSIIISKYIFDRLENYETYDYRYLGYAHVKGKKEAVPIFEIYNTDYPKLKKFKSNNKIEFEKAVSLFIKGNFKEAKTIFNKIWKKGQLDKTVQVFIEKCNKELK